MGKERFHKGTIFMVVMLVLALAFAGCSGKGSSGNTAAQGAQGASFNIKGSSQLIALSNTVAPASTTQSSPGFFSKVFGKKKAPFEYKIVNQGLSAKEVKARAKGKKAPVVSAAQDAATPAQSGSNLLSIDAQGNATLAIDSQYMIKVMYSVTDPTGAYVYLALDTGFLNPDGNDYTKFIAKYNCAFYKVSTTDNTSTCVQEGVYVQPIDDTYMQRVSGNQKPIQFDAAGNMYFPGTTFQRTCDDTGVCTMAAANWKPRIYRVAAADSSVTPLTQDNQQISYYLVLPTGEIAYQSMNTQTGEIALYLWKKTEGAANVNGTTTDLTGSTVGVDFFNVDNYNTIMWGGWNESGMRFARPATGTSLIEKATLNTKNLWTDSTDYLCDPKYSAYRQTVGGYYDVTIDSTGNRFTPSTKNATKCQTTYGPQTSWNSTSYCSWNEYWNNVTSTWVYYYVCDPMCENNDMTCMQNGYQNDTFNCPNEPYMDTNSIALLKQQNSLTPYPPRRIVVGDDGKLYGLFVDDVAKNTMLKSSLTFSVYNQNSGNYDRVTYNYNVCNDPNKVEYDTVLKIHQILPYNPIPKAEITFKKAYPDQEFSWQQWMGSTPFQVSNGFLFYKETKERTGFGNHDVIQMVDLTTRKQTTLLDGENDMYQIYSWRLKENKVYFAALDLANTEVITGEINTALVSAGALPAEYLSTNAAASALGATGRVQDIEPLAVAAVSTDTTAPYVKKFYITPDNVYSMSIEFSKPMNKASVESALAFKDMSANPNTDVASMKVWINNFLHLIPDLDQNNTGLANDALLDLSSTTPLKFSNSYKVAVGLTATDTAGTPLTENVDASTQVAQNPATDSFQTKPDFGWYVSDGTGKYAGPPKHKDYGYPLRTDWYDMNVWSVPTNSTGLANTLPDNYEFRFKVRDLESGKLQIMVYQVMDQNDPPNPMAQTTPVLWIMMDTKSGNQGSVMWANNNDYWLFANGALPADITPGTEIMFKLDVYGPAFNAMTPQEGRVDFLYSLDGGVTYNSVFNNWYWCDWWNTGICASNLTSITSMAARNTSMDNTSGYWLLQPSYYKLAVGMDKSLDMDDIHIVALSNGTSPSVAGELDATYPYSVTFDDAVPPHGVLDAAATHIGYRTTISDPMNPLTGTAVAGTLTPNVPELLMPIVCDPNDPNNNPWGWWWLTDPRLGGPSYPRCNEWPSFIMITSPGGMVM